VLEPVAGRVPRSGGHWSCFPPLRMDPAGASVPGLTREAASDLAKLMQPGLSLARAELQGDLGAMVVPLLDTHCGGALPSLRSAGLRLALGASAVLRPKRAGAIDMGLSSAIGAVLASFGWRAPPRRPLRQPRERPRADERLLSKGVHA
jgi:hypothetical protein